MQDSSSHRRRLRAPAAAGVLALSFGTAFTFGHTGDGEPKVEPVRSAVLTVARDVPAIPAIPALAVSGAPPAFAKPAAHRRRPKRHDDASPARHRVTADPDLGSPAATSPSAPSPPASPAPSGGSPRSGGGGRSTGGGNSGGDGAVPPAVTPAPVQAAPAPVAPAPDEGDEPEEEASPEEEAG